VHVMNGQSLLAVDTFDAPALVAWALGDVVKAKLAAMLKANAPADGLSAKEREAKLAALDRKILGLERKAEAIAELIESRGGQVERDASMDYRALLGLADSMAAPSEH
jgi:hypothetical protein